MFLILLLLSCILLNVQSNPVKTFVECPSGTNDCVKNGVQEMLDLVVNPNSDIGAEELDPMFQKEISVDLGFIKYSMTNSTLRGYKTCKVQNVSSYLEENTLHVEMICQSFDMRGQYDIKGKILKMNVEGNGDYSIVTGNYYMILDLQVEIVTRDGKKYFHINNFSFKADPLEPLTYNVTNLFGGNKQLGDDFLKLANKEWKPLAYTLQDPVFRANYKKMLHNANKHFKIYSI